MDVETATNVHHALEEATLLIAVFWFPYLMS
jgi:hypothetical protein